MRYEYEIIRLQPAGKKYCRPFSREYYENSLKRWKKYFPEDTADKLRADDEKIYDNYLELDIPPGASRIGGPAVDLPEDIGYPEGYCFMAQLNCGELKKYDCHGLLPGGGFLYFFTRHPGNDGVVLYSPREAGELKRTAREHLDWYFSGRLIGGIHTEIESLGSRYVIEDGKKVWDYFAGTNISKIYGIYTNCQACEEDVIHRLRQDHLVLLLQIGSDFLDEGTQCVYIDRKDLAMRNFSRCTFEYNQS